MKPYVRETRDLKKLTEKEWNSLVAREKRMVQRDTISLWHCCGVGRLPPSHSQNSFGVVDEVTIKSMQWAITNRVVTPMQLEEIKMKGDLITAAVVTKENPNKCQFKTIMDPM